MSQPLDLVSPDEIIAYVNERNVSEQTATGIKLLRRAADTIAWATEAVAKTETDPALPHDATLEQVALALGADFIENLPWQYRLDDVLEYIANMHTQLNGLQQGIVERDQIIARYEQPVMRAAEVAADDQDNSAGCDSVGEGMSTERWIGKATEFAHKMHGFALALDGANGARLKVLAEDIIESSPIK